MFFRFSVTLPRERGLHLSHDVMLYMQCSDLPIAKRDRPPLFINTTGP